MSDHDGDELPEGNALARKFLTDKRSPLVQLLGDGAPIPHRVLDGFAGAAGRLKGKPLALRALSYDAIQRAAAAAVRYLTAAPPDGAGFAREDLYTELAEGYLQGETKVQVLARALVDPAAPGTPLVHAPAVLREALEPDELAALWEAFLDYQESRSPISQARSWEEVEAFIIALGKGSTATTSLSSFDSGSLRFMLRELAARWVTATRRPSSDTSPPSGT